MSLQRLFMTALFITSALSACSGPSELDRTTNQVGDDDGEPGAPATPSDGEPSDAGDAPVGTSDAGGNLVDAGGMPGDSGMTPIEGLPLPTPDPRRDRVAGPGLGNLTYGAGELFRPIAIIDRSNDVPAAPFFTKAFGLNVVTMHNGYLLALFAPDSGGGPGGMLVYDVQNPRAPRLVHRLYEPDGRTREWREAHAIGLSNFADRQYLALHTGKGVEFWDYQDAKNPQQISKLALPGVDFGDYTSVSWQLFWQGRTLYVAGSNQGIFIVDASDPSAPKLVNRGPGRPNPIPTSELGGFRVGPIFAVGNLLVISSMDTERGYATLDIGDPHNPRLLSALNQDLKKFYAINFNGNRIIGSVRDRGARMTVHDVSDPREIVLENDALVVDEQLYCATQDQFIFQGCQNEVVKIDVSKPDAYRIVGRGSLGVSNPDHGQITPMGNLVFVGNDHGTGSGFIVHDRAQDTTAPEVNMVSPEDGAVLAPLTTRVGITLTDMVELHSLNETTFIVREIGGTSLPGRYSAQHAIATFWPDTPLKPNTPYEVIVQAGGISDWVGNTLTKTFRSTFTTTPLPSAPDLPQGLIARWLLDEVKGSAARDTSQTGADGTLQGNARFSEGALQLSGASGGMRVEHPALSFDGALGLSLWVKTSSTSTDGNDTPGDWFRGQWLVDQDRSGRNAGWALTNHHGKVKFYVNENAQALASKQRIDDGTWHHIVAVREPNGRRRLYIDGTLEAEATSGSTGSLSHRDPFFLGSNSGNAPYANASLRDVQIYQRALSVEEIARVRQSGELLRVAVSPMQPVVAGESARIEVSASGPANLSYSFRFGDGSAPTPFGPSPVGTHKYAAPGHYEVIVTVTDGVQTRGASLIQTVHRPLAQGTAKVSSTVIYVPTNQRVCNVNPDNSSVTCSDAVALNVLFEAAVGKHPRTLASAGDGSLWVVNQDDASISVLRGSDGRTLRTLSLPRGSRPYAIVLAADGQRAFVSLEGTGEVLALRMSDGAIVARANVGSSPRGLSLDGSGQRLFVSRFISSDARGEVRELDPANLVVRKVIPLALDDFSNDGEDRGRGLPNYLSAPAISPDGARAWVGAKSDNILRGLARDGQPLNFENTVRAIAMQVDLTDGSEVLSERIDFNDRELPSAIAFTPLGDYAYVALQGSRSVAIRDAYSGELAGAVDDTGIAPQGVVLSQDGARLFVHNFLSRTLRVYDVSAVRDARNFSPTQLAVLSTVTSETLPANVLRGKQIFYDARDPRMSRDGYISCASCHIDGGHDGRTWDFSDRGEGLRNTITLEGRAGLGHGPLHWTANFDEVQDFENDIRAGFGGSGFLSDAQFNAGTRSDPLGATKAGLSAELDALAAYVTSLDAIPKSPFRTAQGTQSSEGQTGAVLFGSMNCAGCHGGPAFTDSTQNVLHNVGTMRSTSGQRRGQALTGFDTPSLRGVWATGPYLHDGSAGTLHEVLTTSNAAGAHSMTAGLSSAELSALVRYLLELE